MSECARDPQLALLTRGPPPVLVGARLDRSGRMKTLTLGFGEIRQTHVVLEATPEHA